MSKCRICFCTDEEGCPAICSWAELDLCSVCHRFREDLLRYVEDCHKVSVESLGTLLCEVADVDVVGHVNKTKPKPRKMSPRVMLGGNEVCYMIEDAVGRAHSVGPVLDVAELLAYTGFTGAVIRRYDQDKTKPIVYRWNWKTDRWDNEKLKAKKKRKR